MNSMKILTPFRIFVRFYKSDNVRVRFAPSPTGYLHLGGLRTALYNFLFAKSKKGKFILRIEDTDQTRLVEGAAEKLKEDLLWAGIDIDEGPNIGGRFGPYTQSERLHIYRDEVEKLLNSGEAYHCFCTERRLDLLRREALRNREIPKYDNKCRHFTKEQVKQRLDNGDKFCLRFKLTSDLNSFEDLIYGKIHFDVHQQEGDPVIMKTDGYPTYHFANVVDDHLMEISHVLRGVEWQISTTKHLQMYRAFGWEPPEFGHLPLLLNSDGTKFSKRQNDIKIDHYKNTGVLPLALMNFIVNAGGGFEKDLQQNVKPTIFTLNELADQFDLRRLNTSSGKLMADRLREFNRLELKRRSQNPSEEKELICDIQKILKDHFKIEEQDSFFQIDADHIRSVLHWSIDRVDKIQDLISPNFAFLWTLPKEYNLKQDEITFIEKLIENLEIQIEFSKDFLIKLLRKFADEKNLKFNAMMKTLRQVLSGLKEGPAVAEMMELLGKNNTIYRLKMGLNNAKR